MLRFFKRPYTFLIEAVQALLEGEPIPEEFLYLMPSQTPCSIHCQKSKELLKKWKETLERYDPEAAKALRNFNERNIMKTFKEYVKKFKTFGVRGFQFISGYIFISA